MGVADNADHRVDLHGLAFLHQDLLENTGGRRGDFRVNLVRRYFEQRFVALDFVSGFLQPLRQRAFENTFPHLGHDDFCFCHGSF